MIPLACSSPACTRPGYESMVLSGEQDSDVKPDGVLRASFEPRFLHEITVRTMCFNRSESYEFDCYDLGE